MVFNLSAVLRFPFVSAGLQGSFSKFWGGVLDLASDDAVPLGVASETYTAAWSRAESSCHAINARRSKRG